MIFYRLRPKANDAYCHPFFYNLRPKVQLLHDICSRSAANKNLKDELESKVPMLRNPNWRERLLKYLLTYYHNRKQPFEDFKVWVMLNSFFIIRICHEASYMRCILHLKCTLSFELLCIYRYRWFVDIYTHYSALKFFICNLWNCNLV